MPYAKVKPIEDAKANIDAAAASMGDKYKRGISTGKSWKSNAASESSERLFNEKMQEVLASKSRQKGIESVTEDDWKRPAMNQGANSIGTNFRNAKEKWATKTKPYLDVIASTELPERTADGVQNVRGLPS